MSGKIQPPHRMKFRHGQYVQTEKYIVSHEIYGLPCQGAGGLGGKSESTTHISSADYKSVMY